ncbi:MAG: hypothetical protein LBN74_05305, partial [Prevotella sp.]|nr:hypothetical protein [Prevotella sp.]
MTKVTVVSSLLDFKFTSLLELLYTQNLKSDKSNSFQKSCLSDSVGPFLLVLFPARNHRLLAFLLPKAAK